MLGMAWNGKYGGSVLFFEKCIIVPVQEKRYSKNSENENKKWQKNIYQSIMKSPY